MKSLFPRVLTFLALLAAGLALYAAVATVAWLGRARLVYPGVWLFAGERGALAGAERWERRFGPGPADVAHAFYVPPPQRNGPARVVIVLHGNGELAHDKGTLAAFYRERGFGVLVLEYRGYGGAGGTPDFRPIVEDMLHFHDRLVALPEIDPARVVAHGISLGGSFAAELTRRRPVAGLVLHSTFTSLGAMAWRRGLPGFLFGDDYRTIDRVRAYAGPVFVVHGGADGLIPPAHGRALAEAARKGRFLPLDGEGHVILISNARLQVALDDWLWSVAGPPGD